MLLHLTARNTVEGHFLNMWQSWRTVQLVSSQLYVVNTTFPLHCERSISTDSYGGVLGSHHVVINDGVKKLLIAMLHWWIPEGQVLSQKVKKMWARESERMESQRKREAGIYICIIIIFLLVILYLLCHHGLFCLYLPYLT